MTTGLAAPALDLSRTCPGLVPNVLFGALIALVGHPEPGYHSVVSPYPRADHPVINEN